MLVAGEGGVGRGMSELGKERTVHDSSIKKMMRLLEQIDGKQVVSSGQQVVNSGYSGQQVVSSEQQVVSR